MVELHVSFIKRYLSSSIQLLVSHFIGTLILVLPKLCFNILLKRFVLTDKKDISSLVTCVLVLDVPNSSGVRNPVQPLSEQLWLTNQVNEALEGILAAKRASDQSDYTQIVIITASFWSLCHIVNNILYSILLPRFGKRIGYLLKLWGAILSIL